MHFHICFDNLLKGCLEHTVNVLQSGLEEHDGGKAEVALGHMDFSQLSREVVNLIKQIPVDEREVDISADFCFLNIPGIKELVGTGNGFLRDRRTGLSGEQEVDYEVSCVQQLAFHPPMFRWAIGLPPTQLRGIR